MISIREYSLNEIVKITGFSKNTLRYYDNEKIVVAQRSENKYRYYLEQDLLNLLSIKAMKHAGFSLNEIVYVLNNKNNVNCPSPELKKEAIDFFEKKKIELTKKIQNIIEVSKVIDITIDAIKNDASYDSRLSSIDEIVFDYLKKINREESINHE